MASELHLDPERLHVHGRRLTAILDDLLPMPKPDADARAVLARTDTGTVVLTELDRTLAVVDRAARERAELVATLHAAVAGAAAADRDSARAFLRTAWERA